MKNERLRGRKYVNLIRCSTHEQADTSIRDQRDVNTAFAADNGLIHSTGPDLELDGVSGSRPGARTDIEEIIERKRNGEDFDVLLVQDTSRLTRAGSEHGGDIEFDLLRAGIDVVFTAESLPDGDHAGICKSVQYYAAQQFAKSLAFGVARGQMSAIANGSMMYCLCPPYGVDRLFMTMAGKPTHVIRNVPGGPQLKLDATTGEIIDSYPTPKRGEKDLRYRKQDSEKVMLIPGDPAHVNIVRLIYHRRLVDGWGPWRIAKELNDRRIPSPRGNDWSRLTVKNILSNPIYTGVGIANRRTGSIGFTRSANQPKRSDVDKRELVSRKRPRIRRRPRTEWVEQQHPALADYLGDLRERAVAHHAEVVHDRPLGPRVQRDKHVDSAFLLKTLLRSKQGNHALTGSTHGSKNKPYRYYHIATARRVPSSDGTMRRLVRAEPLERAVLGVVSDVLASTEHIRPRIEAILAEQAKATQTDALDLASLRKAREGVARKIEFVIDEIGTLAKDAARAKIRQLESELADLDTRISKAESATAASTNDQTMTVETILGNLARIAEDLTTLPPQTVRVLLSTLIRRMEIDMETLAVELELALPDWAMALGNNVDARMGVDEKFLQRCTVETQRDLAVLAAFRCERVDPNCVTCRRAA